MALVVQISIRTSCGYLKYADDFGQLVSHGYAIFEYFQVVQKRGPVDKVKFSFKHSINEVPNFE